jgi:hypothetical protein
VVIAAGMPLVETKTIHCPLYNKYTSCVRKSGKMGRKFVSHGNETLRNEDGIDSHYR